MSQPNSRQASILIELINSNRPIPAKDLGVKLGLSARIIRYNIPLLQKWLSLFGARIDIRPRIGLMLWASEPAKEAIKAVLINSQTQVVLKPSDRRRFLLFELLTRSEYQPSSTFEKKLSVSANTLGRDLRQVEGWLETRSMYLQRRPGLGTIVVGREDDRRHAIISLILEVGLEQPLLELCLWGILPLEHRLAKADPLRSSIVEALQSWGVEDGWRKVSIIERGSGYALADSDHLSLAINWAVMISRYKAGFEIQFSESQLKAYMLRSEYGATTSAALALEKESGIQLPPQEIAYFTLHVLASTKGISQESIDHESLGESIPEESAKLAFSLAEDIGNRVNANLTHPEVIKRLSEHLARSLMRLRHGMPILNPLTEQVRQAYPSLWRAASETAKELSLRTEITLPPQEVAFITMYMGMAHELSRRLGLNKRRKVIVVCPSGGVTVWMLTHRLQSELPELEVVDTIPLRQLGRLDERDVDAIITTAQLSERNVPVITVSPLVNQEDVSKIRSVLSLAG